MASALFKLSSNGGSSYLAAGTALADANALAYSASSAYSIKAALDSTAGVSSVSWTITSADDENLASLPTVTTNSDKTCTFSVTKTGGAWLLQCRVNGGVNAQTGAADTSLVKALAIKVLNSNSQQEVAVGEVDEAGTYGWTKAINDMGRTAGSSITESALRTAAAALTASLSVNSQKITSLATPSASTDAATKGYVDTAIPSALYTDEDLWPVSIDGTRTCSSGGTETALTGPACYSDLTFTTSGSSLSMAGFRLVVTGTLTIGSGCILHNDSPSGGAGQSGTNGAPVGELATALVQGANGGNANSTGGSSSANAALALGGAGGAGGTGAQSGGTAPTATAPTASSNGTVWTRQGLESLCAVFGTTFTKCRGGAGGAGGGGGAAAVGAGGGGGGGLAWIRAKTIVNNGRISCRGGSGNSSAGTNAGGGGGGGGGFLVIWCDSWTGTAPDCTGGTGSAGNGTGTAGSNGSAGKVLVFVKGALKYRSGFGANAPDLNTL